MSLGSISRRGGVLALGLVVATAWSGCNKSNDAPREKAQDAAMAGPSPRAAPTKPAPAKSATSKKAERGTPAPAELPPVAARGSLLQRLPKTTLVALRFPHVEKLREAWKRTPLHTLLDLPQLAEQRQKMDEGFEQMKREMTKQLPDFEALKAKVMAIEGELVVAVVSIDASAITRKSSEHSDWPFTAAMLFDAGEHADEVDELFQRFFKLVDQKEKEKESGRPFELVSQTQGKWHRRQQPEGGCVDLARDGTQFVLQAGPAALAQADGAPMAPRSLDDSFCALELVRATPDLGRHGSLSVAEAFVNLAPIWTAASVLAPAEVKNILDGSGATSIQGVSLAAGLGKSGIDEAMLIYSPSGKDLLTQVLTNRPLDPKLARFLPPDSAMASLTAFDLAALVDGIVKLLPSAEKKQFEQMLAGMRSEGFDLRGDLIGNIGPTFGFAGNLDPMKLLASQGPGQNGPSAAAMRTALDFTLLIELQDAPRFRKMVDKLLRSSGAAAHIRPEVVQGVPTSRLEAFPVPGPDGQIIAQIEPSWHVGDDALVFSTSSAALERALAAARGGSSRGPSSMKSALEQNASSAWHISSVAATADSPLSTSLGRRTGFGLELSSFEGPGMTTAYVLGAGVGVVASVAIPHLLEARVEANEKVAVATLRSIASAEAMFQASTFIDQDRDGVGEYGTLAELTGTSAPMGAKQPISPPVLATSMAPDARGCFTKAGYVFRIDVPRRAIGGADASELRYVAYAWPASSGGTGLKVYMIDPEGTVFFTDNRGDQQHYEGQDRVPTPDASELRDEGDRVTGVTAVRRGRDGGIWLQYE